MPTSTAESSDAMFALEGELYGEFADDTCGMPEIDVTASSTACSKAGSRTSPPAGATATSCADVPLTSGNVRASASSASCDSVPGITYVFDVPALSSPAPATAIARTPIHKPSTIHRARNAHRPSA
jgi:hypothetical protein